MNLQGKIHSIGAIEEKGADKFKTRKLIIDRTREYEGRRFVNHSEITLLGDDHTKIPETLNLQPGDVIKCEGDIKGRFFQHEGKEKFAQDFNSWKIEIVQQAQSATGAQNESDPVY